MKTKIIRVGLSIVFLTLLNGCTVNSSGPSSDDVNYRSPYQGHKIVYNGANYDVGYGPDADDIDFNHDSAVGYGGVNVYDYNGI